MKRGKRGQFPHPEDAPKGGRAWENALMADGRGSTQRRRENCDDQLFRREKVTDDSNETYRRT